jgi:hypothetical protein
MAAHLVRDAGHGVPDQPHLLRRHRTVRDRVREHRQPRRQLLAGGQRPRPDQVISVRQPQPGLLRRAAQQLPQERRRRPAAVLRRNALRLDLRDQPVAGRGQPAGDALHPAQRIDQLRRRQRRRVHDQ